MGTVIAVASGKGGTGKTSFCAGISAVLCAMGEKVLLIDADAGLRNLDLVLGMTDSLLFSYADVMMGRATLKEAAVAHPLVKNLRVLTAPAEPCEISPPYIAGLLQAARVHFSFTLIDCPSGLSGDLVSFAAYADRAIIVSTADHTSLARCAADGRCVFTGRYEKQQDRCQPRTPKNDEHRCLCQYRPCHGRLRSVAFGCCTGRQRHHYLCE